MADKSIRSIVKYFLNHEKVKQAPLPVRERMLINFFSRNLEMVKQTFQGPDFFPRTDPDIALRSILEDVRSAVLKELGTFLDPFLESRIDFSLLKHFHSTASDKPRLFREKLVSLMKVLLTHHDVRYRFSGIIPLLESGTLRDYVKVIFEQKGYIYQHLLNEENLLLDQEEYTHYLKLLLLLKNAAWIKVTSPLGLKFNLADIRHDPGLIVIFFRMIEKMLLRVIPDLDSSIIWTGLMANVRQEYTRPQDVTSRLLYIFSLSHQGTDRPKGKSAAAQTPDKSRFYICMKNFGFFGFDVNILRELYNIASYYDW
ncbi:MAG: hypothetical protein PHF84_09420 [bacterium]|nr:hypothetical protein [bacterium]